MRKVLRIFFCILLLVVFIGSVFACDMVLEEKPAIAFKELCQNKKEFYRSGDQEYLDGVVIFISDESDDYFVATYFPLPEAKKNLSEQEFVVVKANTENLALGDVFSAKGRVDKATGEDEQGNKLEVYYLNAEINKTGQTKANDPDFEELVKIVDKEIQDEEVFTFFIIWYLFFSPTSPLSPMNMMNPMNMTNTMNY